MRPGADPGTPKRTPRKIKCTNAWPSLMVIFLLAYRSREHAPLICFSTMYHLQYVWYKYFLIYHHNANKCVLFCTKENSKIGLIILHLADCAQDCSLSGQMAMDNAVKFLGSMSPWWNLKCTFHPKRSTKHGMKWLYHNFHIKQSFFMIKWLIFCQ